MNLEPTLVGILAVLMLFGVVSWLVAWIRDAPVTPDPWESACAAQLEQPDCLPVCHRCLSPQQHPGWHCPSCGAVVGPYSNYLPYVYLFSVGEVFRNGVQHHLRRSRLVNLGYLLLSSSEYLVLAPLYWYRFFKNLKRCQRAYSEPNCPLPPGRSNPS